MAAKSPSDGSTVLSVLFSHPGSLYFAVEVGRRAMSSVSEKKECCAYRQQFPIARLPKAADRISLLWTARQCTLYFLCTRWKE